MPGVSAGATTSSWTRWRRLCSEPAFVRLLGVRLLGQAGDGALQVALAAFVLFSPDRAATAAGTAAAFAVLLLPYSVVGPFAGVLLDRWSRQRVLVAANVLRCGGAGVLAALVASDVASWPLYAVALLVLGVNRFVLAALSSALPLVVRDGSDLVLANTVTTTGGTVVGLGVGGGVGALLRVTLGDGTGSASSAVLAAVLYVAAAGAATTLAARRLGPLELPALPARAAARRVLLDVAQGARHLAERRPAAYALAAITAHRFFYGVSFVATILLYRNYFSDPADTDEAVGGLALVFAASAVGVLLGAAATPWATDRHGTVRWVVGLFALAAVVEVVLGAPYTEEAFLGAALLLGVVAQGTKICVDTVLQESVDDAFRGRVFAVYDIVFNVAFVAAAAAGAVVLPDSGKSYAVLLAIAAGYAAVSVAYGWASRGSPPPSAGRVDGPRLDVRR